MAIYGENDRKAKEIYANIDGATKEITSVWVNKDGIPSCVFQKKDPTLKIVTWQSGTDEEIAAMLDAYYAGEINIYDYWHVGDTRTVSLSAMAAAHNCEAQAAQTVQYVLANVGGKTLDTPINDKTTCAFIVVQKSSLKSAGTVNSVSSSTTGWYSCTRRAWCNDTYYNSIPESFRKIFKLVQNSGNDKTDATSVISTDYFALPSVKELLGSIDSTINANIWGNDIWFEWYKNENNRKSSDYIWTRTSYKTNFSYFKCFKGVKTLGHDLKNIKHLIRPFGCI